MPFQIVAHLRRGPVFWGPYVSRGEADQKLYELWAEKIHGVGRLTPWEIVGDPPGPGTFTVWKQDLDAGRQWRVMRLGRDHAEAKQSARDFQRAAPFLPHSPERTVITPDGARPPPREPSFAIEVKARALGHDGWERARTGMSARDAEAAVKALRGRIAHLRQDTRAAHAVMQYLGLRFATLNGDWKGADVRAHGLDPFPIIAGHRYCVVRSDWSGRWKYGEIGVAVPNDFDKYDAKLVLKRPPRSSLPEEASMGELLDHMDAGPVFYFYRDDIEPMSGPSKIR